MSSEFRQPGEPFVPRDGARLSRPLEAGEIIVMSYIPRPLEPGIALPFEQRLRLTPPPLPERQKQRLALSRQHYFTPFKPEATINTIDPELTQLAAENLIALGFTMLRGVCVPYNDPRTVDMLVASEIAYGVKGNHQTLFDELESGSYIGPFAIRAAGQALHGAPTTVTVLPGVGLWSRPAENA